MNKKVKVIGAGLAGCEAANFLAKRGIKVTLYEQKPLKKSPAHHIDGFAELVCSNSLKAKRINSAGGLLKAEMREFGSICLDSADKCEVPAGGALAVNRADFSRIITENIKSNENITVVNEEVLKIDDDIPTIVATGPLTQGALADSISELTGDYLSFYDAAAPIITAESIDKDCSFTQSRYDRGNSDDYINCPMNKEEYEYFHANLIEAESANVHSFDKPNVYEGCMPIEIMAKRGADTMRFGPLKPVGLTNPKTGHRPWANLQLRKENKEGTLYNLVGFQTNLKFSEQKRVFSLIPALKNAEFMRYGVMHRNSFINSPKLLDSNFKLKNYNNIWFAGQITGVEGYMESAMSGILSAVSVYNTVMGFDQLELPVTTMCGALSNYISSDDKKDFQPMGANFGIIPHSDIVIKDKQERYSVIAKRSLNELKEILRKRNYYENCN